MKRNDWVLAAAVLLSFGLTACSGNNNQDAGGPVDSGPPVDAGPKPDAGGPCNPITQDCTDPTNTKCTTTEPGSANGPLVLACVAPQGDAGLDAPCQRQGNGNLQIGNDNCAGGFFCSGFGSLQTPPNRHCRQFCQHDAQCESGDECMGLTTAAPFFGICIHECQLYGTDCPAGAPSCAALTNNINQSIFMASCREVDGGTLGAPCNLANSDMDCPANAVCIGPPDGGTHTTCQALCDPSHPCATGQCFIAPGLEHIPGGPDAGGFDAGNGLVDVGGICQL